VKILREEKKIEYLISFFFPRDFPSPLLISRAISSLSEEVKNL
jgi:hypothetical protein